LQARSPRAIAPGFHSRLITVEPGFIIRILAIRILAGSHVRPVFEFQGYRTNHPVHVSPYAQVVLAFAAEEQFIGLDIGHLILQSC